LKVAHSRLLHTAVSTARCSPCAEIHGADLPRTGNPRSCKPVAKCVYRVFEITQARNTMPTALRGSRTISRRHRWMTFTRTLRVLYAGCLSPNTHCSLYARTPHAPSSSFICTESMT
ncbi:hypothetical protein HYPSUDRAFT_1063591, partial [Hypholoma sublateritium FD-334 SS-4]